MEKIVLLEGKGVHRMIDAIRSRLKLEEGQALVEYALVVSLIAVVAIGGLTLAGGPAPGFFSEIANIIGP